MELISAGRSLSSDSINELDFQVQALIGATHRGFDATAIRPIANVSIVSDGETSDLERYTDSYDS